MAIVEDADAFLEALYGVVNGSLCNVAQYRSLGKQMGWDEERTRRACRFLIERGFVSWASGGGLCELTAAGIDAVEQRQPDAPKARDRLAFLTRSYEESGGDPWHWLNVWEMGEELQWERGLTKEVFTYLAAKDLLQGRGSGGTYAITERAVDMFVRAKTSPDSVTAYFPPLSSLSVHITGSTLVASPLGSPGASVHTGDIVVATHGPVQQELARLREAILAAELDGETREEALQTAHTLQQEHAKAKPNKTVVRACWDWLKEKVPNVLEGAGKAAIEAWVKAQIGS